MRGRGWATSVRVSVYGLAQHAGCHACSSLWQSGKDEHARQPTCWASLLTPARTQRMTLARSTTVFRRYLGAFAIGHSSARREG